MPYKLAGFRHGKPYVAQRVPDEYHKRLMIHQRTYLQCRKEGLSRTASIAEARKREHRGMSKKEIRRYEGKLGSIARRR